jgi:hypothetical protein
MIPCRSCKGQRVQLLEHVLTLIHFVFVFLVGAAADIIKRRRAKGSGVVGELIPTALVCDGSSYWNMYLR